MISRIKQGLKYILVRYDKRDDDLVRCILNSDEYRVFSHMGNYDKLHSVSLLKELMRDNLLSGDEDYMKLALLHDCGKGRAGLIKRVKLVVAGDAVLEKHPEKSHEILLGINSEVARLSRDHHKIYVTDEKMKRFQDIDERN